MDASENIANIAFYRFVTIEDPSGLREKLFELSKKLGLMGTILIAEEGINAMLAGGLPEIDAFIEILGQESQFKGLSFKKSYSSRIPFKYLRVKVKKEILTLRRADVDPRRVASSYIKAGELLEALKSAQPITLIDVRNDFEVGYGTFQNALNPNTKSFGEFVDFVNKRLNVEKTRKIVTFCTGGIRCEKAAIILENAGYQNVLQLEGGILEYFKTAAGEYFNGSCFVFDERVALDAQLKPIQS